MTSYNVFNQNSRLSSTLRFQLLQQHQQLLAWYWGKYDSCVYIGLVEPLSLNEYHNVNTKAFFFLSLKDKHTGNNNNSSSDRQSLKLSYDKHFEKMPHESVRKMQKQSSGQSRTCGFMILVASMLFFLQTSLFFHYYYNFISFMSYDTTTILRRWKHLYLPTGSFAYFFSVL